MRQTVSKDMVLQAVRYAPGRPLAYLSNAKAGCSGVAAALWKDWDLRSGRSTFSGNAHALDRSPFVRDVFDASLDRSEFERASFFSIVRNPFVRILSGYLDKIRGRKIVWEHFAARFGLPSKLAVDRLSFRDFLVIVSSETDELIDAHFRPQYLNLLWSVCRPHFVGRLEEITPIEEFHKAHGLAIEEIRQHATGARERLAEHYTQETVALVRAKYAPDFALFGYSDDVDCLEPIRPVAERADGCEALIEWIANDRFPFDCVDTATARFQRFREAKSDTDKLSIARESAGFDDNWQRIQAYQATVARLGDAAFAAVLGERKHMLRQRHRERLPELFASARVL